MQNSKWTREPYRLFFPLGVLLAWAGLFHWVLLAIGWTAEYRSVFHSIAQIQGFMTCFGVGFLMTAIPRRTGTAPPAPWQVGVGLVAPVATTVAAWCGKFALSQIPWIVLIGMLIAFAVRRFRSGTATRRPPNSFVWIPFGFAMGLAGFVLFSLYGALGLDLVYHELGKLLVLQGVFLSLVLGVGGMVLPLITCGDAPPDARPTDTRVRLLHALAALGVVGTFVLEVTGHRRVAYLARAAIVLCVLLAQSRIARLPTKPGTQRWLVWLSAWAIPIGFALAALLTPNFQAGLHVVFIAGFGMMALSVGLHVSLAHGGREDLVHARSWPVGVMGALILTACAVRALATLDPTHMLTWIGISAALFLLGTMIWVRIAVFETRG